MLLVPSIGVGLLSDVFVIARNALIREIFQTHKATPTVQTSTFLSHPQKACSGNLNGPASDKGRPKAARYFDRLTGIMALSASIFAMGHLAIMANQRLRPRRYFLARLPGVRLGCHHWASKRSADVATGTVKWFNPSKGYGFIQPDGGGKDVFVHISAVEKAGFTGLAEGAKISYEVVSDRGKESAGNLRL